VSLAPEQAFSAWGQDIARLGPFKVLDAVATIDESAKNVTIAVINRDREQAQTASLDFARALHITEGAVYEINGPDAYSENSFAEPNVVGIEEKALHVALDGQSLGYTFPAHSVTVLTLKLA
jgi:alpha-L-arabinofuranosidase